MHSFTDLAEVERVLTDLMERSPAVVTKLPRLPGRKEPRYCQLFSGEPDLAALEAAAAEPARGRGGADEERVAKLEEEVSGLRAELSALRDMLAEFRKTFE